MTPKKFSFLTLTLLVLSAIAAVNIYAGPRHKKSGVPSPTLTPIPTINITYQSNDGQPDQTNNFPAAVQKNYVFQEAASNTYVYYEDGNLMGATTPVVNVSDSIGVAANGVGTDGNPTFPVVAGYLMQ